MKFVIKDKNSYLVDEYEWSFEILDAKIFDDKEGDLDDIRDYEERGYRIVPIKIMEGI